jgi:hypothetical protein
METNNDHALIAELSTARHFLDMAIAQLSARTVAETRNRPIHLANARQDANDAMVKITQFFDALSKGNQ